MSSAVSSSILALARACETPWVEDLPESVALGTDEPVVAEADVVEERG
jgi:hypothetical protein